MRNKIQHFLKIQRIRISQRLFFRIIRTLYTVCFQPVIFRTSHMVNFLLNASLISPFSRVQIYLHRSRDCLLDFTRSFLVVFYSLLFHVLFSSIAELAVLVASWFCPISPNPNSPNPISPNPNSPNHIILAKIIEP